MKQADKWEDEMLRLENDPTVSKRALRLFMQSLMECGHSVGELLTCDTPPYGCSECNAKFEKVKKMNDIYVIIEHDFDNFANHSPRSKRIVGFTESEWNAQLIINNFNMYVYYNRNGREYRRHDPFIEDDHNLYPYWTFEKVKKINVE